MRKVMIAASVAALVGLGGVAVAAQGDQQAGEAGRQRHAGGMLFQSDSNNDGVVTRAEFDAGRTAMFTRMDANNDGTVTREEMRAGWREGRHHGGRGEGHHRGGRRGGHGGGHGFERADANNDGNITRDEFLARPIAHFERIDANSDGVISANERPQRGERGERRGRGGWTSPDANNDGSITQAEFVAAGASHFERLDANRDGQVTREEAQAARGRRGGN